MTHGRRCNPIAVSRHAGKKSDLLAAGAAGVIVTDEDNAVEGARRHTNGVGADIILDSVMGPGLLELAKAAKSGGTLVAVGRLDPRPAPAHPDDQEPAREPLPRSSW
jgi:NADPH:quinone reductase-like Zn-dependent oxidoreductase